jgi:hypothetical protein
MTVMVVSSSGVVVLTAVVVAVLFGSGAVVVQYDGHGVIQQWSGSANSGGGTI